jgi:acyl transferase domain-containing protein
VSQQLRHDFERLLTTLNPGVRNMVSPVQFTKAIGVFLLKNSTRANQESCDYVAVDSILELGPHSALQGPLRQILQNDSRAGSIAYIAALLRGKDAVRSVLEAMGELWSRGKPVHIAVLNMQYAENLSVRALPDLPRYPWK